MPTFALTVQVPVEAAEDVAALLLEAGAAGAEVRDGSLVPMPGTTPPPAGRAEVVAFFTSRGEAQAAAEAQGLAGPVVEVAERDWSETWKEGLAPFAVGRVFVRPSWIEAVVPPGAVEVVLDPGMAFGTGTHPTTALCLAALDTLLRADPGAHVLDVGTGSGLLAIAAARLGAGRVAATEDDPVALRVAEENALRNGAAIEAYLAPPEAVPGAFRIVLANILANTLVALAPGITSRLAPGGTVILAGLVAGQEEAVGQAYRALGLAPRPDLDRALGEWRLAALRRPAP